MNVPAVRFLRPQMISGRSWRKGDICTTMFSGVLRQFLQRRGVIEILDNVKDGEVEAAVVTPPENAAIRTEPIKRKRGRPRKKKAEQ